MKHSHESTLQKTLHTLWLFAVALQVLWMLVLYSGWVINSAVLNQYLDAMGASREVSNTSYELPDIIAQPLTVAVVISIIVIIGLIMARTPKTAAQVTVRASTKATQNIEPVIRRVVPKKSLQKNRWYITSFSRIVLNTILWIISIPMVYVTEGISPAVIWAVSTLVWVLPAGFVLAELITHRVSRSS